MTETRLEKDQVVPAVALREHPGGDRVRLTDYRQRRALVVAFLHAGCDHCAAYADGELAGVAEGLKRSDGLTRVVVPADPDRDADGPVPVWVDDEGHARERLLGSGQEPVVLVLDSYASVQEVHRCPDHDFPSTTSLVEILEHLASLCG